MVDNDLKWLLHRVGDVTVGVWSLVAGRLVFSVEISECEFSYLSFFQMSECAVQVEGTISAPLSLLSNSAL
jgi:hypothetical protein